jgi:tRNA threonylcarbamoyl adenosine modification protein (Sua5/YciO/YrdC/YwlC family)
MIYILPTDTCYGIACALEDKKNYEKIYKIKKRRLDKPLAIMVKDFSWLRENTDLTDEQVDFLERYEKPFTILTNSTPVELFINFGDENEEYLINKDMYEQVAFRVAHNEMQESVINTHGPIWLTSANLSGAGETYDIATIEKDFEYYIDKNIVEVVGSFNLDPETPASDIIEFD